jgi:WD40 repeat protein
LRASGTLFNPKVISEQLAAVNAAAFTTDERWLVTGYDDGTVGISDLGPPEGTAATRSSKAHKGPINAISIGPDDHSVATASEDGTIGVWNLSAIENPEEIKRFAGHSGPVHHVIHSGDGKLLVTGGFDGTVRVWDLTSRDSNTPRNVLAAHSKGVSWYTSGTAATAANEGAKWKLTDLKTLTTRERDSHRDSQSAVALQSFLRKSLPRFVQRPSPPSNLRIAGNNVREVKAGGVTAIAISTDNRWLVTAGSDGFVKIWDLRSANLISCKTVLKGHEEWVSSVRLGAADAYIATGSWDGAVRLWGFGGEKKELNAVHAHFSRLDKLVTKIPNLFQRSQESSQDRELGAELIDWAHDICARNLTRGEWERHFPGQPYKKTFNDLPSGAEKD